MGPMEPSEEQMHLGDLPNDLLAAICEHILIAGEAHWAQLVCKAWWTQARVACRKLHKHPITSTSIGSIFLSHARLAHAMTIVRARHLVLADCGVSGAHARARSLGSRYVWSPAGEVAIAARAPLPMLDYLWHDWAHSTNAMNSACFLKVVARGGRRDVLEHWVDTRDAHDSRRELALAYILERAGFHDPRHQFGAALHTLEQGLMAPALSVGRFEAIEWCYERLDRDAPYSGWRAQLDVHGPGVHSLARLTTAAATGDRPVRALDFLCQWMYPRFGSRAPSEREDCLIRVLGIVLCSAVDCVRPNVVGAWEWMARIAPMGVTVLIGRLAGETDVNVAPLSRALLKPRTVAVYEWMSKRLGRTGWLDVPIYDRDVTPPPEWSEKAQFANLVMQQVCRRCVNKGYDRGGRFATWKPHDRALWVRAMTDLTLGVRYGEGEKFGCNIDTLLQEPLALVSPEDGDALVDALVAVHARAEETGTTHAQLLAIDKTYCERMSLELDGGCDGAEERLLRVPSRFRQRLLEAGVEC